MVVQKSGRKIASALKRKPKAQKTTTHKHVTLKAHHAKPYRKRHVGLLLLCVAALIVIGFILVKYRDQILRGEASSKDFISDIFGEPTNKNQAYNATVESSYGFSISYDQREFYASAINGATGKLALGAELNGNKPFTVIRLAPQYDTDSNEALGTALTITYHTDKSTDDDPLEAIALQDGSLDAANLSRVKNEDYTIDGKNFTKITWQSKLASNVAANLKTNFVTYTGIVDGHAITVVLSLGTDKTSSGMFDAVVSNIKFGGSSASLPSGKTAANTQKAHDLLDIVTNAQFAEAANKSGEASLSEKTAALYSSAVIKVYHAYCMDIYVNDTPFLGDACQAASGSGFIVSQNGYIGTNGHVAAITVKELAIYGAILQYYSKGDS
ncbi:MAG: hypothetical protein LBH36_02510, partial [Candidatus Nomurabacteria bacterium]|nr:hypothetical protein [Candidatus Nomurabacteria bacterium]